MSRENFEPPRQPEATLALLALACGVIGVLGDLISPPIGLVIGALALSCGLRARQGNVRQNMAIAGAVLGAIAVVVGLVLVLIGPVEPLPPGA